jgi:streptogramin lyase
MSTSHHPAAKIATLGSAVLASLVLVTSAPGAPGIARIVTPGSPGHMMIAYGSLWVSTHRGGFIYRIDPKTNHKTAINVGNALCGPLAVGGGAVYAGGCDGNPVTYKISAANNRVVAQRRGTTPVFAAGSLWTLSPDLRHVWRVDPRSGVVLAKLEPGIDTLKSGGPMGYGYGSLWDVADTVASRIDVTTDKVTAVVPLPGSKASGDYNGGYLYGDYVAFAAGKVWITNAAGIYVIDPTANIARLLPIPLTPMSQGGDITITVAAGSVWVRTSDTTVVQIDPKTEQVVKTYPALAAGGGGGIAVGFGSLWIANVGIDSVSRLPIP